MDCLSNRDIQKRRRVITTNNGFYCCKEMYLLYGVRENVPSGVTDVNKTLTEIINLLGSKQKKMA